MSAKIKQNHENFTGKYNSDFENRYLSKQYGAQRLLSELPDKGWKLGSTKSLLKRIRKTGTTVQQPGSGRPRSSRTSGGPCAQSGGQAKKAPVSS